MRLLPLLFLSACVSPTQYAQGVPVAPRPPTFNPAWDAPITTGQPGYVGPVERAPRGTDKRVLPPTREPGVWATKASSHGPPYPLVHMLGVVLETYDNPAEMEWDTTALCAVSLQAAGGPDLQVLASLPIWPRACAVAKLYRHCAEGVLRTAQKKKAAGDEYDEEAMKVFRRIVQRAQRQEAQSCKTAPTADVVKSIRTIAERWTTENEKAP